MPLGPDATTSSHAEASAPKPKLPTPPGQKGTPPPRLCPCLPPTPLANAGHAVRRGAKGRRIGVMDSRPCEREGGRGGGGGRCGRDRKGRSRGRGDRGRIAEGRQRGKRHTQGGEKRSAGAKNSWVEPSGSEMLSALRGKKPPGFGESATCANSATS